MDSKIKEAINFVQKAIGSVNVAMEQLPEGKKNLIREHLRNAEQALEEAKVQAQKKGLVALATGKGLHS